MAGAPLVERLARVRVLSGSRGRRVSNDFESVKPMRWMLCAAMAVTIDGASLAFAADSPQLDLNDVSWLCPVPQVAADLQNAIAVESLKSQDGSPVWSDEQFADVLSVADSDKVAVGKNRIRLPQPLRTKSDWHVSAFRFDPSAPGCSEQMREQFGSTPQLRLIVQPVTSAGDKITVHDFAIHLVFSFDSGLDDKQRRLPDREMTRKIIVDLDSLKKLSEDGGAKTSGLPLMVHPGLAQKVTGLQPKVVEFLCRHLNANRLSAMTLMGLDPPEPWIFVALAKFPPGAARFTAVPFLPPQMISFRAQGGVVTPALRTNNRNPVTSNIILSEKDKRGVSTAALFGKTPPDRDAMATIGVTESAAPIADTTLRNRDISDLIANPTASHFFNTDCVSCHTETRRRIRLSLPVGAFAYLAGAQPPKLADGVMPKHDWNVRNFGWFLPSLFIGGGAPVPTATQRTANETAEVVEFIEQHLRTD